MERQPRKRKRDQQNAKKAKVNNTAVVPQELPVCNSHLSTQSPEQTSIEEATATTSLVNEKHISQSSSSHSLCREGLSSTSQHRRSPSPARFYREREQSELQNLNGRLSSHVEHVKQLQSENARLKIQIQGMEVIKQEMMTMKKLHGDDIERLQNKLDTATRERYRLEQSLEAMSQERDNVRETLAEKTEEVISLEKSMKNLHIVSQKYEEQQDELKELKESLQEKEADVARVSDELVKVKVANKRLEEEAQRDRSLYMKEIDQARTRINQHFDTYDQRLEVGYEEMVNGALAGVREQHVRDLADLKEELTTLYQTKLVELKTKAERADADLLATRRELKTSKTEQDSLRSQTVRFKMDAAAFKVQFEEEQTKYQDLTKESEKERCQLQRELVLLKQELTEVRAELEEVGGANMRLEQEIRTYRVILDDLESKRPLYSPRKRSKKVCENGNESPSRVVMSKIDTKNNKEVQGQRTVAEAEEADSMGKEVQGQGPSAYEYLRTNEMSQGVQVEEVDPDGRYIRLVNETDHLVDLCLWTVRQSTRNKLQVQFEIPCSTPLATDQRLIIWSQGEGPFVSRRASSDAVVLSLPDPTLRPSGSEMGTNSTGKKMNDILHLSMPGKHWLHRPSTMNVRLQDGDGQLQAKSDLTSIQNEYDGLSNAVAQETSKSSSSGTLQKLSKLLPFYANNKPSSIYSISGEREEGGEGVCGCRENGSDVYIQSYKKRHTPKRVRSSSTSAKNMGNGDQAMSKDECSIM